MLAAIAAAADLNLNKFDPIKGIETSRSSQASSVIFADLNKFDPIKGIETKLKLLPQ